MLPPPPPQEGEEEGQDSEDELSFAMSALMAPPEDDGNDGRSHQSNVVELASFHLNVIFDKHKTGFEREKDWVVEINSLIADRYLVIKKLGEAAFSNVFQCLDTMFVGGGGARRHVCLKVIKNSKEYFDQSLDEIKMLR